MLTLEEILKKQIGAGTESLKPSLTVQKKRNIAFKIITVVLVLFLVAILGWLYKRVAKIESKQKMIRRSVKMLEYSPASTDSLGKIAFPIQLAGIPYGEKLGIVLTVKDIPIRNVIAPYNPGLIKTFSGYELFFRYDVLNPNLQYAPFSSRIGVVSLNPQFEQTDREFQRINVQSEYADDPRALCIGNELYLFYNALDESNSKCRFMYAANLDRNTYEVNYRTPLDLNLQWVEKNWSPFAYIGEDRKPHLLLEYKINPRKLMELPDPRINDIKNVPLPSRSAYLSLHWAEKWGQMSGGTPLEKIGDEYLGFFHSWFTDKAGLIWYVMGAYTFEAKPPFDLTGISRYPLLFKGIYETPFTNTAPLNKRVIFPSGIAVEKVDDRDLIYLACGENDCSVKVVTLDKEKLLKSLLRFKD